jgi:uncharacterized protein DUF5675
VATQEFYHGAKADNILSILREGVIRPQHGKIYVGRFESQFHNLFRHGGDDSRKAAFVIKIRAHVPENCSPKRATGLGAGPDDWVLETGTPIRVEVLQLFVRHKPGEPIEVKNGPTEIGNYLQPTEFKLVINRKHSFAAGIVGELFVNGSFVCYTLELAWLWNEKDKSCVPPGTYRAFLRTDHKDKWRIQLEGVPGGREAVQIHIGNFPRDIKGCVIVGNSYSPDAVHDSAAAYEKLKSAYRQSPGPISVEFKGILATPWGDYPRARSTSA